ncbi:MAG: MFS transporter [Alphaproteobacteria bacterium]
MEPEQAATEAMPYRWVMLGGAWLLYFCFGLTTGSLAPLVNVITGDLGLSHSAMGSILGAWPLVYIVSAVPCGAVLDRIGPRRALFMAGLIIALSGLLRGLAPGYVSLFLAVALFGIGGPLISVGGPKLVSLWFRDAERGLAMGIFATGPALGVVTTLMLTNSVAMPLAGGNWRAVLMAYAALVLLAALAWFVISARGAEPDANTVAGTKDAAPDQSQFQVFAGLLRLPALRLVLATSIFIFFFNHGMNNWLPEILRTHGMDAATAGFWAAIPHAVGIVAALVIPRLAGPARRFIILGGLFLCAGVATLLIESGTGPLLAAGLMLQGTARGAMSSVMLLVLMATPGVDARTIGSASGLYFSAGEIGGVLGPLSVGYLFDVTGGFSTGLYLLTGITALMILMLTRLRALSR